MKPLATALLLPSLLGVSGARLPEWSPFLWSIGPFTGEVPCAVSFRFDPSAYPNAYFFADIKGLLDSRQTAAPSSARIDELGYASFQAKFDVSGFPLGEYLHFRYGLSKKPIGESLNILDFYIYGEKLEQIQKGQDLVHLKENAIYENPRDITVYDPRVDEREAFSYRDAYALSGGNVEASKATRLVGIKDVRLEYRNPYAAVYPLPTAELRLLDHLDEFKDVALDHVGYRSLLLKVTMQRTSDVGATYSFSLSKPLYYSRVDYRMDNRLHANEPHFVSDDFYLPLREGHDEDTYRYQIVLRNAGAYQDTVIIEQSCRSLSRLFGPCGEAPYCVAMGEGKDGLPFPWRVSDVLSHGLLQLRL